MRAAGRSSRNVEISQAVARLKMTHPELDYLTGVFVKSALEQQRDGRARASSTSIPWTPHEEDPATGAGPPPPSWGWWGMVV